MLNSAALTDLYSASLCFEGSRGREYVNVLQQFIMGISLVLKMEDHNCIGWEIGCFQNFKFIFIGNFLTYSNCPAGCYEEDELKDLNAKQFCFSLLDLPTVTCTEVLSVLNKFFFLSFLALMLFSLRQVRGHSFKQCMRRVRCQVGWGAGVGGGGEWRWQGSWHLTWRLSDRRGTIRSASACHPSRPLRNRAAGKGPVNCLQMCLDACFTDKLEAGATLWWYRWSLLICISLAVTTLKSLCEILNIRVHWLWPFMDYFLQSADSLHISLGWD